MSVLSFWGMGCLKRSEQVASSDCVARKWANTIKAFCNFVFEKLEMIFEKRTKEHVKFAEMIGIKNFSEILPRMSRDFLVKFNKETDALNAENLLKKKNGIPTGWKIIFSIQNLMSVRLIQL